LCLHCNQTLEENQYLRLVYATFAIAFGFHLILRNAGYPGTGLISETFMTEVLLLIPVVAVWKLVQKIREPQRKILYELVSLYSDRTGRILIIGLMIVTILYFLGIGLPFHGKRAAAPNALIMFRKVRFFVIFCAGISYMALSLWLQG